MSMALTMIEFSNARGIFPSGATVPFTGLVAYGASKFAMRGLTQACGRLLAPSELALWLRLPSPSA